MSDSSREGGSLGKTVPLPPADARSESAFGHPGQQDISMVHQGVHPRRWGAHPCSAMLIWQEHASCILASSAFAGV